VCTSVIRVLDETVKLFSVTAVSKTEAPEIQSATLANQSNDDKAMTLGRNVKQSRHRKYVYQKIN